uniref:Uncharacterized protein n=1 Tax=Populus trichocarpa TaxID=3694 RepID=B9GHH6_POPTR
MEHSTRFRRRQTGEDVIIGSIDTSKGSGFGVLRESGCEGQQSRSSDDEGMGPVPSRWKGIFWLHTIYRPLVVALFLEKMFLVLGTELLESTNIRIQECRISTWCENHKGHEAELAGAVGMIFENVREHGNELLTYPHVLPAAHIDLTDGEAAIAFIISAKKPPASISPGNTDLGVNSNPAMAKFSSRGPNSIEPAILEGNMASHLTSIRLSNGLRATPFAHAAGHVQPNLAADPGLVYGTTVND